LCFCCFRIWGVQGGGWWVLLFFVEGFYFIF
jgi:hypothetical protein